MMENNFWNIKNKLILIMLLLIGWIFIFPLSSMAFYSEMTNDELINSIEVTYSSWVYNLSYPKEILNRKGLTERLNRKIRYKILENFVEKNNLSKDMFSKVNIELNINKWYSINIFGKTEDLISKEIKESINSTYWEKNKIWLSEESLKESWWIYFNSDDIYHLFDLNSYRYRKTTWDASYRIFNIKKAYELIWGSKNIYPLNRHSTFSYNKIIEPNLNDKVFKYWLVIKHWKLITELWWWLCGWTTWIFQWIIWNKNLEISGINHSFYYSNLYDAFIQWDLINIPGLDIAYYENTIDLSFKNKTNYPILLVNYIKWNKEFNFTLNYKKNSNENSQINFVKKSWLCYSWNRDWNIIKSCYKKINPKD
jgi:hypothetical protein